MNNKELEELVIIFKEYRDLLVPLQNELSSFTEGFDGLKENLNQMDKLFEGDINGKLDKIYNTLYQQSQKSFDLSTRIDTFMKSSDKYIENMNKLITKFDNMQKVIDNMNNIDIKAEEQMKKLDDLIQERKINYNVKDLQKSLDNYTINVQKVSDFLNKDFTKEIENNTEKITKLTDKNDELKNMLSEQSGSLNTLLEYYANTSKLFEKAVVKEEVNEEYIFEILDKWALSRKLKIKK